MLLESIESRGLSHYSYIIGYGPHAAVIDPRRDIDVYLRMASRAGMTIRCVLETHRNEDYVVGSTLIAAATGASVWHADSHLDYAYGEDVEDGRVWRLGRLSLEAVHTPGHTPGSMSYLLHDTSGAPWILFTGDCLFAGGVGRVDLAGGELIDELAASLYDSIFGRILPLGDGVLLCPSHGAGSVCGGAIADRKWTSVGLEKRLNPALREGMDRRSFIERVSVKQPRAPCFRTMERMNIEGAPLRGVPSPPLLSPRDFSDRSRSATVLDTRTELA